jgi:hypothetical protein
MSEFKFQIDPDKSTEFLSIKAEGTLDRGGFMRMVKHAREMAYQEQLNLFYDMRDLDFPEGILLSDVLTFVRTHTSLNDDKASSLKSASLIGKELLGDEIWEVYKYASNNAGLEWQFFTDEAEALSWLSPTT